jgi:transcription elongation factor GreA
VVLPFANLRTAEGVRKKHGISAPLLVDDDARPATDAERRAAAGRGGAGGRTDPTGRTGVLRSRTALGKGGAGTRTARSPDGTPAPRRMSQAAREAAAGKAAKDPTRLSEEGLAALRAELEELTTVIRPAIVARIVAARELGDLKENSDYHEARREQSFAEGRVRAIEDLLRNVVLIEGGVEGGRSRLGSTVVVEGPFGEEEIYTLVGSTEASPAAGRISTSSPIGAVLLDRVAGDEVEAVVPSGRLRYRIVEVR